MEELTKNLVEVYQDFDEQMINPGSLLPHNRPIIILFFSHTL